jgi:hypothetical protein
MSEFNNLDKLTTEEFHKLLNDLAHITSKPKVKFYDARFTVDKQINTCKYDTKAMQRLERRVVRERWSFKEATNG